MQREMVKIKRVYEPADATDGFRILVDRLWPRGLKKETARVDLWMKEVAPTAVLRKWFQHDTEKWAVFIKAYKSELKKSGKPGELVEYIKKHKKVTLLYAAKDEMHNNALVLEKYIKELI
jgi:uncharacterized protein YeaO (DUF488 family)